MRNILLLSLLLLFYGTSCQSQNNKETVSSDSSLTENPSGILLSKRYTNEEDGYSINYPPNWNYYEYENAGGTDFFGHFKTPVGNEDMSDMGIAVYEKADSKTFDEYCEGYITEMKSSGLLSDITIEKNESFIYQDKFKAFSFVITAKSVGTFDTRVHMFIEQGNEIYHLRGLLSPKHPSESLQLYLEIMKTIQFLK